MHFFLFLPPHQRNKQWGGEKPLLHWNAAIFFFLFFPRREEDAPVWCTDVLAVSSTVEMEMKMEMFVCLFVCLLLVRGGGGGEGNRRKTEFLGVNCFFVCYCCPSDGKEFVQFIHRYKQSTEEETHVIDEQHYLCCLLCFVTVSSDRWHLFTLVR